MIERWVAQGQMPAGRLGFSPLSALHPDLLNTPLSAQLEAGGHSVRTALDPFDGKLRPGFEEAFRSGNYAALDWWLARAPELANRVPPRAGRSVAVGAAGQDAGQRLARPADPATGRWWSFLLARGANPGYRLPQQPDMTVLRLARQMNSPLAPLLEQAPVRARVAGRGVPGAP